MATATVTIYIRVPPAVAAVLRQEALAHETSVNAIVNRLLADYTGQTGGGR